MRIELEDQENTEIGFAPLLDCIFLLLVFFLVATSFNKQEEQPKEKDNQELAIELPTADVSFDWNKATQAPLSIGIDTSGRFYLKGEVVSAKTLTEFLRQEKRQNPQQRIRIDGDKRAMFQSIVQVMEICQLEGFTNIGVHIRN